MAIQLKMLKENSKNSFENISWKVSFKSHMVTVNPLNLGFLGPGIFREISKHNYVIIYTMILYYSIFLGQKLTNQQKDALAKLDPNAPWQERILVSHRRLIGILIPFCFFQICWWCLAFKHDLFSLFPERYILSITMILGATVAGNIFLYLSKKNFFNVVFYFYLGMTSEGGGAVAFPVMTLALNIPPPVARDFSLMIQSCGEEIFKNFDN